MINSKGAPVDRASVYVFNTNYKVFTNEQGLFTLKNIEPGTYIIQVSAAGYASLNQQVVVDGEAKDLTILLNEEYRQLNEVVVTAQKRDEDPQKVPFSMSVISGRQVQDYRIWNIKDITAIAPNLYSANSGDNRNVTSIRGVATTSYDQGVVTCVDGVSQFRLDTYIPQLLDVERIEVLRGPQGTLYGRNAMGGVINIVTRQPTNEAKGFAGVDAGNYGTQRYTAGVRSHIVKDKLFAGISGLYTRTNGFYTNDFNYSHFDKQSSVMGSYYVKYLSSPRLSFTLNIKHIANRNKGTFPLISNREQAYANPYHLSQDAVTQLIDNIFHSSLSVYYTGKKLNFTSQTAYQSNYRYYASPIDADFSPLDAVSIINNYGHRWNNVKVGTQEFKLMSRAGSLLNWTLGSYLFYQNKPVKQGVHFGKDAARVGAPFPNFTTISTNNQESYGWAFFADVQYSIRPKLTFGLGLRYDDEHKRSSIRGEFQKDGQDARITRSDTSSSAHFTAFSPKASLAYSITPSHQVYGVYSRGFRAGGISELASDPSQPPLYTYLPEHSDNWEIGTKNSFWNNRFRFNLSVFFIRITDAQVPTLVLPDAITVIKNAGKLSSKGMEAELAFAGIRNLEIEYSFGYTHARYTDLKVAASGSQRGYEGNRQVFTPDVTSMLMFQYGHYLTRAHHLRWVLRGEWKYLGDHYFDLANKIKQEAYSLFNAKTGLTTKKFDIFLWAGNLPDKKYISYAYDFDAVHLGEPLTYGISVMSRF